MKLAREDEMNKDRWNTLSKAFSAPTHTENMSAGATIISDDESEELVLVVLNIWGKSTRRGVMVPKDDLSFKSIRDEMMKDRIRVQRPFHFTLGAGGKALSSEQEENWSDWSAFKKEGFEEEYHVFIEEVNAMA